MPGISVALQTELAARHDLMNVTDSGNAEFHVDTVEATVFNVDLSHFSNVDMCQKSSIDKATM